MRKFTDHSLLVATHNSGKLSEIRTLLDPMGISVVSSADMGLEAPEETGQTFVENARIKAHYAAYRTNLPALADDSGVEVEALGGAPGVYTADWSETPEGRDFVLAMTRTKDALVSAGASHPWRARFCATFVLAWPDGHDEVFEGFLDGEIVWPMRGEQGHGYDPIFRPEGHELTLGELEPALKNSISHRADAFKKMAVVFGRV